MSKNAITIPGPTGALEAVFNRPESCRDDIVAVLCHPHPLHEGTMNNKIVTTLERTCDRLDIASVRFNFRGVGASVGEFADGIGETEDCLAVVDWMVQQFPQARVLLAGFSFGGYVAYRASQQVVPCALITVAPAVTRCDFSELPEPECPWLVIQGEADEVVAADAVYEFVASRNKAPLLIRYPDTGHYFHGRLVNLQKDFTAFIDQACR
jgi:uncharacterized protein